MLRLSDFIDRAREKPLLGLLVLILLVALLALVALHPAIDPLELAVSCLTILAMTASIALSRKPGRCDRTAPIPAVARARPPTALAVSLPAPLLVPLRL